MNIETRYEVVELSGNRAQLVVDVVINGTKAGSLVVMSGPRGPIDDFVAGKIDSDEVSRRFGMGARRAAA